MTSFLQAMTSNDAFTTNGAVTHSTSSNYNVDLFFLAGSCRNENEQNIENVLVKAYNQDRLKTLKTIFWAGDIRQGAGERRFFKLALNWLSKNHPDDIQNNLQWIPEFSRWDVVFELAMTNEVLFSYMITCLLDTNCATRGLLCKWLPRKVYATDKKKTVVGNTTSVTKTKRKLYGGIAGKIISRLGITPKQYRKMLVEGSKTVEQKMCAKQWNEIEYSTVPSVAINKYNKAWYRNDGERFTSYIEQVKAGKSKINAAAIFPHDIIKAASRCGYYESVLNDAQVTQWENLPNWLEGKENSLLPVCDVSGSMTGTPMNVSLALGLYISERNTGAFKDAFITFSHNPQLQYLSGNVNERLSQLQQADWGYNTDLIKTFQVILERAINGNVPAEQMPKTILIISDMEFDNTDNLTNYDRIKFAYETAGYQCPNIVFWNVNGRVGNVPVKYNNKGVALISGFSPAIMKAVISAEINPVSMMDTVIESERYSGIK